MINKTILSELTITDLPNEDLRWIAEDCGIETAVALLLSFGGITLYIPGFEIEDWKKVKPENLPNDDMKLVAEKCGMEIVQKLIGGFPQSILYIPRIETTAWAKSYIKAHYSGKNAKRLAATFGVSERFIYKCIKNSKKRHE